MSIAVRLFLLIGLLTSLSGAAAAQNSAPVTTNPAPVYSGDKSGVITVTNTFQLVFAAVSDSTKPRRGCAIQNNGANTMWIYVHQLAAGTASKASSYTLLAGTSTAQASIFNCVTGAGGVLQDQIDITGTANDAFTATVQ